MQLGTDVQIKQPYEPCCFILMSPVTSNENTTLYPMIPDPRNEGGVRMYTEQRLLAENLNVADIIFVKKFTQPQFLAPKIYAKKA